MSVARRSASQVFRRTALWAALSLSVLGSAQALTLNRPVVQSRQGEPLKVEIDITNLKTAEKVDLQAGLASAELYKATRVEFPTQGGQPLTLEVQLQQRKNGRPYLHITSKQAITSATLDLLIDLRWATGRALRDVNLSLDSAQAPSVPGAPTPVGGTSRADQEGAQITVQKGDTASEIAAKRLSGNVSLDQMLIALLRNNPEAFADANINRLKAGSLLTVPTAQQASQVSREEAHREIVVQTQNFNAYRAELAARAPGGAAPKAERSSTGQLQAQVQNKSAKSSPDKLTLSKPKDGGVEAKIAEQREAQDVADRAAELSRNITELGRIAAATAAAAASGVLSVDVPESTASAPSTWVDQLSHHPLTPVGAGLLVAGLVLSALWLRRRDAQNSGDNIQGLPPLNVKFDLELPSLDDQPLPGNLPPPAGGFTAAPLAGDAPRAPAPQAVRPKMVMPDISLDLNGSHHQPFQVRMELADELWKLGQLHTSRALMEEVANESSGDVQVQARQWLAERG